MKTFFVSDLHGAYKGLIQALDKANFSDSDKLIVGGDICDGWSETKEIIDFLIGLNNKIILRGNHDEMALYYYLSKRHYIFDDGSLEYSSWKTHLGGDSTIKSIGDKSDIDSKYLEFLNNMVNYYESDDNKLFVHAGIGIDIDLDIKDQDPYYLLWENIMIKHIQKHREHKIGEWSEIYVGHTPVQTFNEFYTRPKNFGNVWACDTAAGFIGKVSLIDIDSKEVFQSDQVRKLYPSEKGRNKTSYNQDMNKKFS